MSFDTVLSHNPLEIVINYCSSVGGNGLTQMSIKKPTRTTRIKGPLGNS